jgi:hypothetical protein
MSRGAAAAPTREAALRRPPPQAGEGWEGAAADWASAETELNEGGYSVIPNLLSAEQCAGVAALYDDEARFRSRVVMARHNFGRGEYKYFAYPLPPMIAEWHAAMDMTTRFPPTHAAFLKRCHDAGQTRPTPLLLRYGAGDYNCLHQDLYGAHVFPIQATVLLSAPDRDFAGGEFVLTEQRPRMQSRAEVVPLAQGDAVLFAVNQRPVKGARSFYRVTMRHGVSRIRSGQRLTLGIIFHDAR